MNFLPVAPLLKKQWTQKEKGPFVFLQLHTQKATQQLEK